jgi:hypothetical protein
MLPAVLAADVRLVNLDNDSKRFLRLHHRGADFARPSFSPKLLKKLDFVSDRSIRRDASRAILVTLTAAAN